MNDEDERVLKTIESRLGRPGPDIRCGVEPAVRAHVLSRIVDSGRLRAMARLVKWAERLLERHDPAAVFTDGLSGEVTTVLLALAKARGIVTFAGWHSPYIDDVKLDLFGSDLRNPPIVDISLTWGRRHEDYLNATSARCAIIRTGSPVAGHARRAPRPRRGRPRKALLLQYAAPPYDLYWRHDEQYRFFVEAVRMLREVGFDEIRFKLHPGPSTTGYHRRIADRFDLDCEIHQYGRFQDFIEWADIVIGPVHSGAMLEVIAAGKSYYPVLLRPTMVNTEYVSDYQIFSDISTLRRALETRAPLDQATLLEDFAGTNEFSDPAGRIWEVIAAKVLAPPVPAGPAPDFRPSS